MDNHNSYRITRIINYDPNTLRNEQAQVDKKCTDWLSRKDKEEKISGLGLVLNVIGLLLTLVYILLRHNDRHSFTDTVFVLALGISFFIFGLAIYARVSLDKRETIALRKDWTSTIKPFAFAFNNFVNGNNIISCTGTPIRSLDDLEQGCAIEEGTAFRVTVTAEIFDSFVDQVYYFAFDNSCLDGELTLDVGNERVFYAKEEANDHA